MAIDDRKLVHIIRECFIFAGSIASVFFIIKYGSSYLAQHLDPEAGAKQEAQRKALEASNRLRSIFSNHDRANEITEDEYSDTGSEDENGRRRSRRRRRRQRSEQRPSLQDIHLNQYEQAIAMEVVSPSDIPVTFADIGGLEDIIEELRESVIYPLTLPHLYSGHSSLLTAPSGVLLYGPPGCGKTMMAKALARESGACFINLHISTLTEKWYGDSNKLVAALFTLARKLQPSIVFIDEVDALLGTRRSGEHEASGMVKAEFMTHWDGLASSTTEGGNQRICVMGATNRIQDIDDAILRRMPKKFAVGLPNAAQRRSIFELTLRDTKVDQQAFDLDVLVRVSAGMSGSDIKEACRDAAMMPVREYIKARKEAGGSMRGIRAENVRGLQTEDFFGLRKLKTSKNALNSKKQIHADEQDDDVDDDAGSAHSGSTEEVEDFADAEAEAPTTKPDERRRKRRVECVR